jgi:membrane-bound serine protease (ClpP class)
LKARQASPAGRYRPPGRSDEQAGRRAGQRLTGRARATQQILASPAFAPHIAHVMCTRLSRRQRIRRWRLAVVGLATVGLFAVSFRASGQPATVALLDLEGAIGPASADYVERSFDKALTQGADLIVLRMDTPGGLADSMRVIIKAILAAPVPVVGFVAPAGAHAASAGTYILYACHVAAMAPGTNLGAATPVQIGGGFPSPSPQEPRAPEKEPGDDESGAGKPAEDAPPRTAGMEDKIVNDAVAYIRSLAQLRDRNVEWAEQAVRQAASLPAAEAKEKNVIDLVAVDLDDLLAKLDGRTVGLNGGELTLETAERTIVTFEPDWRTDLLAIITNPNVAYILMLIGIYGIIFEFWSPGFVFPGVVGAISLLLALYAFQVLPVNYAGLALIALGIAMMVAEMLMPSFGSFGIGGVIAFVVGSIMLMDTDVPGFGISWQLVGGVSLGAAALLLLLITMLSRSHRGAVITGQEEMVSSRAHVVDWQGGAGRVRVHGEIWRARGPADLAPGQEVRVIAIDGLTLDVDAPG